MEKKKKLHVHPIYTASKEQTTKEHKNEKKNVNKHTIDIHKYINKEESSQERGSNLEEKIDSSSECKDLMHWLKITMGEISSHLQ